MSEETSHSELFVHFFGKNSLFVEIFESEFTPKQAELLHKLAVPIGNNERPVGRLTMFEIKLYAWLAAKEAECKRDIAQTKEGTLKSARQEQGHRGDGLQKLYAVMRLIGMIKPLFWNMVRYRIDNWGSRPLDIRTGYMIVELDVSGPDVDIDVFDAQYGDQGGPDEPSF